MTWKMESFRALVAAQDESNGFQLQVRELVPEELPEAEEEVVIRVRASSLNYKDALACTPGNAIVARYPHIPGIDLAGTVLHSASPRFTAGQDVVVTGFGLGVSRYGGYSQLARVPAKWVVPLPPGLTPLDAMRIGTAGITAAMSIDALERHGLSPDQGDVLVTGATGGVGSFAVALLKARGYRVAASTGKAAEESYLRELGADIVLARADLQRDSVRPLEKQAWSAAVDPVGGPSLAFILASIRYGGAVAVSGLTGGGGIPTTVHPFILRGVSLLGIDSVQYPLERRYGLWRQIAEHLQQAGLLERIGSRTIRLEDVPQAVEALLAGKIKGRVVVVPD
ncbi:MAG: quinone oxidoreductase, YhdH/YhfP family [Paenibacillus sp.]|nr:quinone oxidoreductase, YhdH/YhfP family [Paenibacillus sp.]